VVRSQPGQGSCFDLLLPLQAAAADGAADEVAMLPAGQGQRILVVDDEATRLSLLGDALSSQGYRPSVALDGAAALRLVQEAGLPDAVLVDGGIPLLSAGQLLVEMRGLGYAGPAIVLEADDGTAFADGPAPAGLQVHVLPKPLEMQRVLRAAADALAAA